MKKLKVNSYPADLMTVNFDPDLGEVYQLVLFTRYGQWTRVDGLWREFNDDDDSLEFLDYHVVLPEDYKVVRDMFDQSQFDNKILHIDDYDEYLAQMIVEAGQ